MPNPSELQREEEGDQVAKFANLNSSVKQVKWDTLELRNIRHVVTAKLTNYELARLGNDLVVHCDRVFDGLLMALEKGIAGCDLQRAEARYPRDWWQAFKERWAPRWFLKRWPVKYTMVEIDAKALYPGIRFPELCHTITLVKRVNGVRSEQ